MHRGGGGGVHSNWVGFGQVSATQVSKFEHCFRNDLHSKRYPTLTTKGQILIPLFDLEILQVSIIAYLGRKLFLCFSVIFFQQLTCTHYIQYRFVPDNNELTMFSVNNNYS